MSLMSLISLVVPPATKTTVDCVCQQFDSNSAVEFL